MLGSTINYLIAIAENFEECLDLMQKVIIVRSHHNVGNIPGRGPWLQ